MEERIRKIGEVKASLFKKNFDQIYDYWKDKAMFELGYGGELKFIKEHNRVFIYMILPNEDNLKKIDPKYFNEEEDLDDLDL